MRLLLCVLEDSSTWCRTCTTRDWLTITRRVENEGFSFLTITLPAFGQDFERSLDQGHLASESFLGFKRLRGSPVPAFLSGLLSLIFDAGTGDLLEVPDTNAIFYVRQICYMFKKVLLPCTKRRTEESFDRYIECEQEVITDLGVIDTERLSAFHTISDILWSVTLGPINRKVVDTDIIPKHGPGATAERISGNRKFQLLNWHERLEPFFPASSFTIPNLGFVEQLESMNFLEPEAETPVRVITVPKTLKTPRIIAIEPVCMQYTQQALLHPLVAVLESAALTGGFLNFTDQTVNQRLALSSSSTGSLATLDMKDASDRVSVKLVETMLRSVPDFRDAVLACRSTTADVPGKGVIPLSKFASMGSALCFPIESMVFYTICLMAIIQDLGLPLTPKSLRRVVGSVHVYGDDIIVPVTHVQSVMRELEAFGLLVNRRKSFWTGKFRESCGVDAYDGVPVTPVYCRRLFPTSRRDASEMLSAISLRNQLYKAGCWRSAQWLTELVEGFAPLPLVSETSPVHGMMSYTFGYETQRMCVNLHRPLVFGITTHVRHRKSNLDGVFALLKCLLHQGSLPIFDKRHLERHGRPEAVDIKLRWAPAF
jgi:hypothetical protein